MPRTIYRPGQYVPEGEERIIAEAKHRDSQYRQFRSPYRIYTSTEVNQGWTSENDGQRLLAFTPARSHEYTTRTLDQLSAENIRSFCHKDCALYALTTTGSNGFWREQLFDKVYRHWFPSRAEDMDISHGSFFCQLFDFSGVWKAPQPPSIREVLDFHQALCAKLDQLVPSLADEIPNPSHASAERMLQLPPAKYKMRRSFDECFIVMRGDYGDHSVDGQSMKEHGVVVVFLRGEDATKHGCEVDAARGITAMDVGDLGESQAYRCATLECAMSIVVGLDPQRSMDKRERHGFYRDDVLDQNDETPTECCRCSGCRPDLLPPHLKSTEPVK